MSKPYTRIPTWKNGNWDYTEFATKEQFRDFVEKLFIGNIPGKYGFDETSLLFNEHARTFNKKGLFCEAAEGSMDFLDYWDSEKEKCRKGVIFINGKKTWYLPRWYYHWLNFLRIYNKVDKGFMFPDVMDVQYHAALYDQLAMLHGKHSAKLKKRQIAMSYYHDALIYNKYIFEEGFVGKIMASDKAYIDATNGCWKFLEEYHNFTNTNTAWIRHNFPDKVFSWQQKLETKTHDGRKVDIGTRATITGVTLKEDPVKGVGGACMAAGTPIIMHDGRIVNIEDIKVGDFVCGIDGIPKRVNRLFTGETLMYKVQQSMGMDYIVTGNHMLYTYNTESRKYITIKAEDFYKSSKNKKVVCRGLKFKGIEGAYKKLPIDSYYLGLYLGDGDKYDFRILVNRTRDIEISDYIYQLASTYDDYEVRSVYKNIYRPDYNDDMYNMKIVNKVKGRNYSIFQTSFKQLQLRDKHIPDVYFTASKQQRLELLAGILDTDGYYDSKKKRYELTVKNKRLVEDVIKLCIQLGLRNRCYIITSSGKTSTVYNKASTCYRLNISGNILDIPCRLQRKQATSESIRGVNNYSKLTVTPLTVDRYYGFECEDHLYCLADGTITHNCDIAYYEEGGIAPTADTTFEFMKPAMEFGGQTTGIFMISGSVGDLGQCLPLKEMIDNPLANDIYAVHTDLIDENGTEGLRGLFIPEQWGYLMDKYGNSLVEASLKAIDEKFEEAKRDKDPEKYQLMVSQHPRNIAEAFATRTVSKFPVRYTGPQERRILDNTYPIQHVELERTDKDEIVIKPSTRNPIIDFPVKKTMEDKRGVVCIVKKPVKEEGRVPWGRYYGSLDPVNKGKAEFVENRVFTPNGRKKIGDIKIGEFVIGANGKSTKVLGVYPQGKRKLYRVSFSDSSSILVDKEHLWSASLYGGTRGNITISTSEMLEKNGTITLKGAGRNRGKDYTFSTYFKTAKNRNVWRIPMVEPIEFAPKELPVDPYFMGLLLGDGGLSRNAVNYTTTDEELIQYIRDILPDELSVKKRGKYGYSISKDSNIYRNSLVQELRKMGLIGKLSYHKFIPDIYKYTTIKDRLSILQGLMDTDGYCGWSGCYFYSTSIDLAKDVQEIVQSLGGVSNIRQKVSKWTHKGIDKQGLIYIASVKLPSPYNPFRLKRKADKYVTSKKPPSRFITDIKYERIGDAVCIKVEAPDQLYVTENAIVTHNTSSSESLASIYIYENPIEVTRIDAEGNSETYIEGDNIVAYWCGRYDDINDTNEQISKLVELYNAWTISEVGPFIQYMISKRRTKYLVPAKEMLFDKELGVEQKVFDSYGWTNSTKLWERMLEYGIDFLSEELRTIYKEDGTIERLVFGVERIPDIMLIKEMQSYEPKGNFDRIISYCALIAFSKIQQAAIGTRKRMEKKDDELTKTEKIPTLKERNLFHNIGRGNSMMGNVSIKRSAFKNIK